MSKIVAMLDGRYMVEKNQVHEYLVNKFNFPSYYGKNLDALYDLLVTYNNDEELMIMLIYPEVFIDNVGQYAMDMIQTFKDAAAHNRKLSFKMKKIAYISDQGLFR